jgi:hypothetical protein
MEKTNSRLNVVRNVVLLCPCAIFLAIQVASKWAWPRAAMLGYVVTAAFFGILLVPDYPPLRTAWFWRAMVPIAGIHSAIVAGLVWVDLNAPQVNSLPRMLYGIAGVVVMLEWWLSLRIISLFQPTGRD